MQPESPFEDIALALGQSVEPGRDRVSDRSSLSDLDRAFRLDHRRKSSPRNRVIKTNRSGGDKMCPNDLLTRTARFGNLCQRRLTFKQLFEFVLGLLDRLSMNLGMHGKPNETSVIPNIARD